MKSVQFFAAFAALAFCSCASVTVKDATVARAGKPGAAPKRFYVVPFSTAQARIKEHPMRKHPGQLGAETQKLIADALVAELSKNIAPTKLVSSPGAAGRDGWLITGNLTYVNEGSRILRMGIGLGAGGTKIETRVAVRAAGAGSVPIVQFSTTGGSGAMPGAATNPIPFSSAPSALLASQTGITDDAQRTARMIAARLADYLVSRGWLAAGKVPKAKMAAR